MPLFALIAKSFTEVRLKFYGVKHCLTAEMSWRRTGYIPTPKICDECGKAYLAARYKREKQKFCGAACRMRDYRRRLKIVRLV